MANLPVVEGERLKTGTVSLRLSSKTTAPSRGPELPDRISPARTTPLRGQGLFHQRGAGHGLCEPGQHQGQRVHRECRPEQDQPAARRHIRLQLTADQASLAVLHGEAKVQEPSGISTVGKDKTMTFSLAGQSQPVIAKNVPEEPLDAWDKNAVQYHKSFANASSFGNSPYSYGINDMNYYGSFSSGCGGPMWRPYFASASWNPYGSGAWAYYPSAGYSWVSPYPWGWTPYHYGSWAFCDGIGWGWRPGGTWMGLANNSFVSSPASGTGMHPLPHPPSRPPAAAVQSSLVPVNLKAMPASVLPSMTSLSSATIPPA